LGLTQKAPPAAMAGGAFLCLKLTESTNQ
jgi:hypothetical protein